MAEFTKPVNVPVTFTSTGQPPPLTNAWRINGEIIPEAISPVFVHTFIVPDVYTITHEGSNDCGPCTPVEHTIEITMAAPVEAGTGWILGLGLLFGMIYASATKKETGMLTR